MKAYTRTGDKGETGLYGGTRVGKENPRVEAYGAVDELNSQIGLARAIVKDAKTKRILKTVQEDLFTLGGDLASELVSANIPRINKSHVDDLEKTIDAIHIGLKPLRRFILPTGSVAAAQLQVARAVCRRAERRIVALAKIESINPEAIPYVNRLSSLLFDLSRWTNQRDKVKEEEWTHE
ncbi:MAG TPA: cob(I)yrinic acid a,c-diamide adenosyltransferase [Candidatus Bathyarchaeia archaeon]|nr:cob(I)yrinic acid a,c-diamide adenosyltransferase [Candidatus Bathyarchaeia archaeon]